MCTALNQIRRPRAVLFQRLELVDSQEGRKTASAVIPQLSSRPSSRDADEECLFIQKSSQARLKLRRMHKDELLEALQGKSGARLKEACRLAERAGVDSYLIEQAWAKAREMFFEEELRHAFENSDRARLVRACKLASDADIDEDLISKGEAEARRLSAKEKALAALSSGDVFRIERACRQAELAGVDATFLAPIHTEGLKLRAQVKQRKSLEAPQIGETFQIERARKKAAVTEGIDSKVLASAHPDRPKIMQRSDSLANGRKTPTKSRYQPKDSSRATQRRSSTLHNIHPNPANSSRRRDRQSSIGIAAVGTLGATNADQKSRDVGTKTESGLLSLVGRGLLSTKAQPRTPDQDDIACVANQFRVALPVSHIVSVMRVENSNLTTVYDAFRSTSANATEQELWHGTCEESAYNIVLGGFNRAYSGRHGARYGNGTYFSADAAYSTRFCKKKAGHGFMFLAKVLVGEWIKGAPGLKEPPYKDVDGIARYDSTVDDAEHPTIFCVFHDCQAVPLYLVEFEI